MKGLHWDKIPGDNDDEVAARGILYLLIFQQLGQLVRWSWGYHVLLAPPESYATSAASIEEARSIEEERYQDEPELIPGLDGETRDEPESVEWGGRTPVTSAQYAASFSDEAGQTEPGKAHGLLASGDGFPNDYPNGNITSFPSIGTPTPDELELPTGFKGVLPRARFHTKQGVSYSSHKLTKIAQKAFHALPLTLQNFLTRISNVLGRFFHGMWEFMNPPLWAMLMAVIVASIPSLQRLFFKEGSFIANSVTRAVSQSGGVAVPLILVVLGANLARNTLPQEAHDENSEENQIGKKLLVASLMSRMLLPTLIMAPLLALAAKFVPVSILDDPIFVIVCFLLTGAPSALQLAQICQINGVYEGVMSKLLFQSYVIWYVYISPPCFIPPNNLEG